MYAKRASRMISLVVVPRLLATDSMKDFTGARTVTLIRVLLGADLGPRRVRMSSLVVGGSGLAMVSVEH